LRVLTDHIANALNGMNSQVQRYATSLNVLDRDFQHRIRCSEENQRQFQLCIAELRSETQTRAKQTDDALAELRDKLAEAQRFCSSLCEQPVMSPGCQQKLHARSPSSGRMGPHASPASPSLQNRTISARHPLLTMSPRQLQSFSGQSSAGGDAASMQRATLSAPLVISMAKGPTLASQLPLNTAPADKAETMVHSSETEPLAYSSMVPWSPSSHGMGSSPISRTRSISPPGRPSLHFSGHSSSSRTRTLQSICRNTPPGSISLQWRAGSSSGSQSIPSTNTAWGLQQWQQQQQQQQL